MLLALLLGIPSFFAVKARAQGSVESCAALAGSRSGERLLAAHVVERGRFRIPEHMRPYLPGQVDPAVFQGAPAFCRVVGIFPPRVYFEVWLPLAGWNGRVLVVGNGGLAGQISGYPQMALALRQGYAVAATDTGHRGLSVDGSWALGRRDLVADYAHRAVHLTAQAAKRLTRAFYGRGPRHSYFLGCSTGGRQGLMEAQRYPWDFDGIVAGAPAISFTAFHVAQLWAIRSALATPEGYLSPRELAAVTRWILERWDAADGLRDGLLGNPLDVEVDYQALARDLSLRPQQVEVLRRIHTGPVDRRGQPLHPGFAPGSEYAWGLLFGDPNRPFPIGQEVFRYMVYGNPDWSWRDLDPERDLLAAQLRIGTLLDTRDPDLRPYAERGGKIILWHGWNDPGIPPGGTLRYYEEVLQVMGPEQGNGFLRLFLLPGVEHCRGGPGADEVDWLGAIVDWVERGVPPERAAVAVQREGGRVAFQRPLCPYPTVARYEGGAPQEASSFRCIR